LSLLAYYQGEIEKPPQSLLQPSPPSLPQRVDRAVKSYRSIVTDNNGVKESNLLRLLTPLGVEASDYPAGWLQDMNTFGSDRGDIAHGSAVGVRQPPDPLTLKDLVKRVLDGLRVLDSVLLRLPKRG
jgi:hypothetical protein